MVISKVIEDLEYSMKHGTTCPAWAVRLLINDHARLGRFVEGMNKRDQMLPAWAVSGIDRVVDGKEPWPDEDKS